ncbi:MAG: protein-L-isoaspartate(D-aspartate) O-methyltransferase [Gemmatimonadales bacterium]
MLALLRAQVRDERVVGAMGAVPRERFVTAELRVHAYADRALPIGEGQTISQPLMVGLMTEALRVTSEDRVLEVGTGCGYQAAVLSRLVREVVTVERVPALRERAAALLDELGYTNVRVQAASETLGWRDGAPYDAIIVTAGAPHIPRALIEQLRPGGRLVVPVGDRRAQDLVRVEKTAHGVELTRLGPCAFVPLVGRGAWAEAGVIDASRSIKV